MASADDDNDIPFVPSLPPIIRNISQRYEDGLPQLFLGQNCPQAGVVHSANTPTSLTVARGGTKNGGGKGSLSLSGWGCRWMTKAEEDAALLKEATALARRTVYLTEQPASLLGGCRMHKYQLEG